MDGSSRGTHADKMGKALADEQLSRDRRGRLRGVGVPGTEGGQAEAECSQWGEAGGTGVRLMNLQKVPFGLKSPWPWGFHAPLFPAPALPREAVKEAGSWEASGRCSFG